MRRLPEDRALAVGTVGTVGQNCRTTVGLLSDYCRNLLSDRRTGALPEDAARCGISSWTWIVAFSLHFKTNRTLGKPI